MMNRIRWRFLLWIDRHVDNVCWADLCGYRDGLIREAWRKHRDLDSPFPARLCKAPCWGACGKADELAKRQ